MNTARLGILSTVLAATLLVTACSAAEPGTEEEGVTTLTVAAVTSPMTDVVRAAAEAIDDGWAIDLVEVSDYVTANVILNDGDVYANFSQHAPYMQSFNAGNDGQLTAIQPIYNFVIAYYSKTLTDIADLPDGAKVAIPDDSSNMARALKLLADEGIIGLDPAVDPYDAGLDDISDNPKNLQFTAIGIGLLNAAYDEADLVFQWPSHIAALGLNPHDHGLITELDDTFVLQLVVREEDADSPATKALIAAFTSDQVREVIEANGTIEPAF